MLLSTIHNVKREGRGYELHLLLSAEQKYRVYEPSSPEVSLEVYVCRPCIVLSCGACLC